MKAYLDNNVVSAIAKNDTPQESAALQQLLAAYEGGKVDLVTSELTAEEIKAYQGPLRPEIERIFEGFEKVPIVRWDELLGIRNHWNENTCINVPVIQNDPLYENLLKLGLETIDARHVFVAAKNGRDAFLTCDRGILHRGSAIRELHDSLVVQKPSNFVARHSKGW
jgi:predicted nucleic acid-binding protein